MHLIPCTACHYCTDGCPKRISIPDLFSCLNAKQIYHDWNADYYYNEVFTQNHGKASAMLMIKADIREVFALTISESAEKLLKNHGVRVSFRTRAERIMNRDKTGACPMESAVADTDDIESGCKIIFEKINKMRAQP